MRDREHPSITLPSTGVIGDTGTILAEAFRAPGRTTILVPAEDGAKIATRGEAAPQVEKPGIVLGPHYKLLLIFVMIVTGACGILNLIIAGVWPDPTPFQEQAFEKVSWGFQVGLGALLGLLAGKQS